MFCDVLCSLLCVQGGNLWCQVVQLLLDVGASTTAVDCKGRTPAEACDAETAVGSGREIQGMILQARRAGQILPTQRRA